MRKDTKLYKILKFIYLNNNKKVSSREISESTGIELKQITPYFNRLSDYVKREKLNGLWNYHIPKYNQDYIGRILTDDD